MQDEAIIALYLKRDETAIIETQRKYHAYCGSIAMGILQETGDCEEILSDTWLAAWNAIPPQIPQVLRLFLARITRNLSFNRYHAAHAQKRGGGTLPLVLEELHECIADATSTEGEFSALLLKDAVGAFVRDLPIRERNIFIRRYFYAEPIGDIARRYALGVNHVSVILNRTRKKLRQHLIREGFFHERT